MKRHHYHKCRKKRRQLKSKVFAKALLITTSSSSCCSPLLIAASSNNNQLPLQSCDYTICNQRKRARIKQSSDDAMRYNTLNYRGGHATNNNYMDNTYSYDDDDPRADDVLPAHRHNSSCNDFNNDKVNLMRMSSSNMINNNSQPMMNELAAKNDNGNCSSSLLQHETANDVPSNQIIALQNKSATKVLQSNRRQYEDRPQRQRLVLEFDTQAIDSDSSDKLLGNSIQSKLRSRIGNENDHWDRLTRQHNHGAALSISLDLSPNVGGGRSRIAAGLNNNVGSNIISNPSIKSNNSHINRAATTTTTPINLSTATINTIHTTTTLLHQSLLLLPPLLLTRRALNATRNAIVDYFRGRIFRQTFTRMERAYLRYYEFPAVIRAGARLGSQLGILLGLSVVVRWWMFMILRGDVVGPLVLGMSGLDDHVREDIIGMMGTSGSSRGGGGRNDFLDGILGNVWNVGLPCFQRGRGMAWLCGLIWIGAVVGAGHACTVALSVWGGPLRLQAAQIQAEKPKQILLRVVHHPIRWVRNLEEWKHLPSWQSSGGRREGVRRRRGGGGGGSRVVDLDPLLFPATWLPLRWIQIFAVAKAFSTDPQNYRWCSPENDRIVIPKLMKQYLVQLALGDEWQRVFLGEKRAGLGIVVVLSYFIALLWMVVTAFTLDGGAAAMLIPSVFAAIISGGINFMVFWKRLGTRNRKKALEAIGWN